MPNIVQREIILTYNGLFYKFFKYTMSIKDGSIVFSFPRKGEVKSTWSWSYDKNDNLIQDFQERNVPKDKGYKITYHTTGQINYNKNRDLTIFSEPLYNITTPFCIASYSIPSIEKLDEILLKENSIILKFEDQNLKRLTFTLFLSPNNINISEEFPSIILHNENLFDIHILIENSSLPNPFGNNSEHFILAHPCKGPFNEICCSQDAALIAFHQKLNQSDGPIIYQPNNKGEIRMIFGNEMRIPPDHIIEFENKKYHLEMVQNDRKVFSIFKVKDQYGNTVKNDVKIKFIVLEADL